MDPTSVLTASQPTTCDPKSQVAESIFGCVGPLLADVEVLLKSQLQSKYEDLQPVFAHGALLGGKRMRPALVLLSGEACGGASSEHVLLGTVMEMVHTATLIHDDVLDNASQRRHIATINARWDDDTSILLGDYLFAQAFTLSATLDSTKACQWIGEAARRVCEGELRQVLSRGIASLGEENYIDIIRGKTAELCRVSCQLGAAFAGATAREEAAFAAYGDAMGIAFQIADDFLDVWGNASDVGKTLGTDLDQGKATLPLIRLLAFSDTSQREHVLKCLALPADERLSVLLPLMDASDAKDYTINTARKFAQSAIDALQVVPEGSAKQTLTSLARFAVDRSF